MSKKLQLISRPKEGRKTGKTSKDTTKDTSKDTSKDKMFALLRGYIYRKKMSLPHDNFTLDMVKMMLENHIESYKIREQINIKLSGKKIRHLNFPSEISENIAKNAIRKYTRGKITPSWNTKKGDLIYSYPYIKYIEVKGFSSAGPISFGPTEQWNMLCVVDCMDYLNMNFKVYLITLSNTSKIWQNIKVSKTETYFQQCKAKRRPRLCFKLLSEQIPKNNMICIFNDNLNKLV